MASMTPLSLAESLIQRDPDILVLDLRADPDAEKGIPGSVHSATVEAAGELLARTPAKTTVVVVDEAGSVKQVPASWPRTMDYRVLEGGIGGWEAQVLTPMEMNGSSLEEQEKVLVQNQISAFFSGAAVQANSVVAPPPAMATGAKKKKKSGGC
jgi:rhodanese-related sulfurtransferase